MTEIWDENIANINVCSENTLNYHLNVMLWLWMMQQMNCSFTKNVKNNNTEIQTIPALNGAELKHVIINKQGTKKTQVNKINN